MKSFLKRLAVLMGLMTCLMTLSIAALAGEQIIVGHVRAGIAITGDDGTLYQVVNTEFFPLLQNAVGKKIEVIGRVENQGNTQRLFVKSFSLLE